MRERAVEEVEALFLDLREGLARHAEGGPRVFEVFVGGLEPGFDRLEALHGAHVGVELFELGREGGDFVLEGVFEVFVRVLEIVVEAVKVELNAVVVHGSLQHLVFVLFAVNIHGVLVLPEQHILVGDVI